MEVLITFLLITIILYYLFIIVGLILEEYNNKKNFLLDLVPFYALVRLINERYKELE